MAADDKMSTEFTGELSAGESKAGKQVRAFGVFILVVFLIIGVIAGLFSMRPDRAVVYEERRAAEVAQAEVRAEQVALARARVNEELLRFDEGRWFLQGHTLENESSEPEVFMDSFSVNAGGQVKEFVFTYSFITGGKAYLNTWSCELSQMERYDCSVRQEYDGGSWRSEGRLNREGESSFHGRFLYKHQWYPISLVRKEE
jgi:hypothetical protein